MGLAIGFLLALYAIIVLLATFVSFVVVLAV
jgi:hypothetical protein